MDIGKEKETIVVEPIKDPFRRDPVEPTPREPAEQPEKEPAST